MAIRAKENLVGAWAFLIGVVLAIGAGILSFGSLHPIILGILIILGLVVGISFISVSDKDVNAFLMAAVSLVIVSFAGISGLGSIEFGVIPIGRYVSSTLGALLVMLVPATIIVSIKSMFSIAQR
ncbi:hypothetical protein COU62_03490 [Candidatus Pacearchaeota archaeon CG10_big_fil_rev_8_21_14_0_10_35_219]|nr:hypothetical protein [Candidatus Pacearchaeota archaeon]OIO42348.1 MAG: hypothetical protein AUJ63_03680 [Candidatus Pacearchaeota archaeon CG1_02_35_32]PIO07416.1 MAG: hypothetical protein COU62_03490 [Candidatus Pacearchaeota archaeon CG10_big_fil_rev_8_21_14_0_10_35_219]PIY81222.1 MAG: hypothetical protein COY79_02985 [Candidatus Pacearchaeota archaeon CG_4_10_14_0_8_um_filter_35_169]PIZ80152.1 MAG: hypothetical protein COY00_01635 [Candidatus Pacearchaeota archaeon CG_4_10_14_0_2_um_filt